jgi:hypothetical protein
VEEEPKEKPKKTPKKKVKEEPEEPEEFMKAPPKRKEKKTGRGPSAYGTAVALLGEDPEMGLHTLYDKMRDLGFDIPSKTGSIKTAHSIFRKIYKYLKINGFLKED